MNHQSGIIYNFLLAIFIAVIVLTNIIGVKLFNFLPNIFPQGFFEGPIILTTGIITYPLTFLITDIVSEVFGKEKATKIVILGFIASILSLIFIQIAVMLPGSNIWINHDLGFSSVEEMQNAYESVFTLPGILIFASMSAYLVAQIIDVRIFHIIKERTKGKYLWLRNNLSTFISQLVDTIIVNLIFLYFGLQLEITIILQIIFTTYIFKLFIALIDTPLVYLGVFYIKKKIN